MAFSDKILPEYTFSILMHKLGGFKNVHVFFTEKRPNTYGNPNWGASEWKVKHFFKVLH